MSGSLFRDSSAADVAERTTRTLALMHRWGYAPTLAALADQLLGGSERPRWIREVAEGAHHIVLRDDFVCLRGQEHLLERSKTRVSMNGRHAWEAWDIARSYARDLVRACPFVETVALSGSLASGGYGPHDDIDFDLIVKRGTKYTSYLIAHLVGVRYSWTYRERRLDALHHTPLLPKITCINVVWTQDQMNPFTRRDENMAFELLRCVPMFGIPAFRAALRENEWIRDYFPQAYDRVWPEEIRPGLGFIGRILRGVERNPRMLHVVERLSRGIAWRLYRGVQASRRRNPAAVARMDFLRRAKYPYEVFQD